MVGACIWANPFAARLGQETLTNAKSSLSRNLDKNLGVSGLFGQETLTKTLLSQKSQAISRDYL